MSKLVGFINSVLKTLGDTQNAMYTKRLKVIEEIETLEIELANKMADVQRWGDINDKKHWRTVEADRVREHLEIKKRILNHLK